MTTPYSKTFNKGSKPTKKRRKPKNKNQAQDRRIKKLEQIIYPSIEYKARDISCSNAAVSTSSYVNYPMFQLEQGHGHSQRIGDKVTLKSMNCTLSLKRADSTNVVRVIIAATPSTSHLVIGDILEYSNYGVHGDMVFSSPYKRRAASAEKTYAVLFDKVYNLTTDVSLLVDKFKCKIPKKGKVCEFQAIGSQQPDNFNVSAIAISDSAAATHPVMNLIVRSKYIDL